MLGLSSMIGQIIIVRELIVICYGNELSLGVILASWLFWISVGSLLAGRLAGRLNIGEGFLSGTQTITSLALPLNIYLLRNIKSLLDIPVGKIMGLVPLLAISFSSLAIICMIFGFTFTLISKIASEKARLPSKEIGRIYMFEGLGASIGGLLFSFLLIKLLTPFQNIFIIAGLNVITALLVRKNIVQPALLAILSLAFIFNWPSYIETASRKTQFRPFELIESTESLYGNIAVTKVGKEFGFYENGVLLFTSGDLLTNEEAVHYAMLSHPSPLKILLIGGGVSGSLEQILKHPVKQIDYVELDPLIIKLAEKYITPVTDNRVNIINMDGRLFVKKYGPKRPGYDVIILHLPDPYTAMLNRFYSLEFFEEIKRILNPGGVFSFSLTSSENYINPEQSYYLASIYNTLEKQFKDIKIFPGDSATFLASDKETMLTYDSNILIDRLNKRNLDTRFVREYYLPFKLDAMRIKYIEDSIKLSANARINRDFKPIGYFYHALLWTTLFHSGKGILPYMEKMNMAIFIMIITGLALLIFFIQILRKASFKAPVALSIATTGMSEISFQIIVIFAFQFLYGYMYYRLGIILTSFMIGLVLGSLCINRMLDRLKNERLLYIKTQLIISIYPLILPFVFGAIAKVNISNPDIGQALQTTFAFLPIIAGFIGGFQFPLATKICLKDSTESAKTAGFLYGIDLLGSCVGGLIAGLVFIPIIGIARTCLLLSLINALVLILLVARVHTIKQPKYTER